MKDKNVAGILALFLGWVGIHRFYLGQVGLGILYVFLLIPGISFILGIIDAVAFFVMDQENFDIKYNKRYFELRRRKEDEDNRRRERHENPGEQRRERHASERYRKRNSAPPKTRTQRYTSRKPNPHKQAGIQKYKDYDYQGAIKEFEKALEIDPQDVAVHFNLACAYSLEEKPDKSFYHLDQAVSHGFKDFDRIKQHDALAFLRIQDPFEAFEANGFRLNVEKPEEPSKEEEEDLLASSPDLLDQLKKLDEMRQKGLLTEEEFVEQKKRLMD